MAQLGARHHYAIPRILENHGALEALYTDSCAEHGLGRTCALLCPTRLREGRIAALLQRRIQGVSPERIRSTDRVLLSLADSRLRRRNAFAAQLVAGEAFGEAMLRWGFGRATGVYSMFGESLSFLRAAREKQLSVAVDVFITPVAHRIVAREREQFPIWEGPAEAPDSRLETRIREIFSVADLLLCPGTNVVEGIRELDPESVRRTRVVPYGSGLALRGQQNEPQPGRVLFGGTAELRKGIHYFAHAARRLAGHGFTFVVAGNVTERIRRLPECSALTFLGRVSRAQMIEELRRADVFVLPTLAEGSASVITEALSASLPVITTRAAGSIIEHGRSGLLVPERDAEALGESIESVLSDRQMRRHLAHGARDGALALTESAWAERLLGALR